MVRASNKRARKGEQTIRLSGAKAGVRWIASESFE